MDQPLAHWTKASKVAGGRRQGQIICHAKSWLFGGTASHAIDLTREERSLGFDPSRLQKFRQRFSEEYHWAPTIDRTQSGFSPSPDCILVNSKEFRDLADGVGAMDFNQLVIGEAF